MERVAKHWKGLPGEVWGVLDVALRARGWGQGGDRAQLRLDDPGDLFQFNDPGILGFPDPNHCLVHQRNSLLWDVCSGI